MLRCGVVLFLHIATDLLHSSVGGDSAFCGFEDAAPIVGYQTITIPAGWSMFTPTFEQCDSTKPFTLGDITVCNQYGEEFDDLSQTQYKGERPYLADDHRCRGNLLVNALKSGSVCKTDDQTSYTSAGYGKGSTTWGWGAKAGTQIASGTGLMVNNKLSTPIKLRVSGAVILNPGVMVPPGWSIFGNNTPVDMTLGDITVCNQYGEEFDDVSQTQYKGERPYVQDDHRCRGNLLVNPLKGGTVCKTDDQTSYTSAGYGKGSTTWGWGAKSGIELPAGAAMMVNNKLSLPIWLKLASPIKETK